jgi:hypothetical protein
MQSDNRLLKRLLTAAVALMASVGGACLIGSAVAPATATPGGAGPVGPTGRAAHVENVKDEGHLHLVSESGSNLVEEGAVSGTIPGRVKVYFNIGPTVKASFTIYAHAGGSISGHGEGSLHSTGRYATFGGSLSVSHGTGSYAHAHGSGGLYGAIDRKTYALTVQTVGKLYY